MILLIDNYDSFTYNLVQLLREAGAPVTVVRNDAMNVDAILAERPLGIVLSPGPGRPDDAGVCLDLLAAAPDIPMLGVCLGHQCMGAAAGAEVARAPVLMHGKTSEVRHSDDALFAGMSNPFQATRYHSLMVTASTVPENLEAIAWSDDDLVMALRHKERPYWGVQFHPESVLTPEGPTLLCNFLRRCGLDPGPVRSVAPEEALARVGEATAP